MRPKRALDPGILEFFGLVDEERLYLSAVTLGEIQKGIDLIPWPNDESQTDGRRRLQGELESKLEALHDRFGDRLIQLTVPILRQWGRFHAETERAGRKTPVVDTIIAACAHSKHLVIATTDSDFSAFGYALTVYDPIKRAAYGYKPYWLEG